MTLTTKISLSAAIAASQALRSAIVREKNFIYELKGRGNANDITIATLEKHMQEDIKAFEEVAGYAWFDAWSDC